MDLSWTDQFKALMYEGRPISFDETPFLHPAGAGNDMLGHEHRASVPVFLHKINVFPGHFGSALNFVLEKVFSTGFYHVCVEVHGVTMWYGAVKNSRFSEAEKSLWFGTGIDSRLHVPNSSRLGYRGKDLVGYTNNSVFDLEREFSEAYDARIWEAESYDFIMHNCHAFAEDVCASLGVDKPQCFAPPTETLLRNDNNEVTKSSPVELSDLAPVASAEEVDPALEWRMNGWDWS